MKRFCQIKSSIMGSSKRLLSSLTFQSSKGQHVRADREMQEESDEQEPKKITSVGENKFKWPPRTLKSQC